MAVWLTIHCTSVPKVTHYLGTDAFLISNMHWHASVFTYTAGKDKALCSHIEYWIHLQGKMHLHLSNVNSDVHHTKNVLAQKCIVNVFLCGVHMFSLDGVLVFLPQSKDMQARWTVVCVNVSVNGDYVSETVTDWRPDSCLNLCSNRPPPFVTLNRTSRYK